MLKKTVKSRQRGVSLVHALGIGAVLATGALGVGSLINLMNKANHGSQVIQASNDIKRAITTNVDDDAAWTRTVNLPANSAALGCLVDLADAIPCPDTSAAAGAFIHLVDRKGNTVYDGTAPTGGFDPKGAACSGYDATSGNDRCPFRIELRVKFDCPGSNPTCGSPQVIINSRFLDYMPNSESKRVPFSTDKHSFSFARGAQLQVTDAISRACTSIGGTFDLPTQSCTVTCPADRVLTGFTSGGPMCVPLVPTDLNAVCPVGQHLAGVTSTGLKICVATKLVAVGCPQADQSINRFDAAGNPICLSPPAAPPPPPPPSEVIICTPNPTCPMGSTEIASRWSGAASVPVSCGAEGPAFNNVVTIAGGWTDAMPPRPAYQGTYCCISGCNLCNNCAGPVTNWVTKECVKCLTP